MDIIGRNLSGVDEGLITEGQYLREFAGEDEVAAVFRDNFMVTKEDILTEIKFKIRCLKGQNNRMDDKPLSYYNAVIRLLEDFYKEVEKALLFEQLEDFWSYSYTIEETGIHLDLEHCWDISFEDDGTPQKSGIDQEYRLIQVNSKLLTVEEYGDRYGVGPGTVRQWIRRGKIRSALKAGKEWRIPELAEMRPRGYTLGQYRWEDELQDLPEGYEYLNDYKQIDFWQNAKEKSLYLVVLYPKDKEGENKRFELTAKEKEKLELYFVGNPLVKYLSEVSNTYDG